MSDGGSFTRFGFSHSSNPTGTWFSFNLISGIQTSTTYDVSVRAKIANVWGTYGPTCAITTPVAKTAHESLFTELSEEGLGMKLFPNPTRGATHLAVSGPIEPTPVTITVANLSGQQVYQTREVVGHGTLVALEAPQAWPAGVYLVRMQSETAVAWQRLVVE